MIVAPLSRALGSTSLSLLPNTSPFHLLIMATSSAPKNPLDPKMLLVGSAVSLFEGKQIAFARAVRRRQLTPSLGLTVTTLGQAGRATEHCRSCYKLTPLAYTASRSAQDSSRSEPLGQLARRRLQDFAARRIERAVSRSHTLGVTLCSTVSHASKLTRSRRSLPQAWIESGTTGAILLFTATAVEDVAKREGISSGSAGLLGGAFGGAAQAYLAMGESAVLTARGSKLTLSHGNRRLHLHEDGRDHASESLAHHQSYPRHARRRDQAARTVGLLHGDVQEGWDSCDQQGALPAELVTGCSLLRGLGAGADLLRVLGAGCERGGASSDD